MAEITRVVFGGLLTGPKVDRDLKVLEREDPGGFLLGERDGLALVEKKELGRAVCRDEGDAGLSWVEGAFREGGVATEKDRGNGSVGAR